MKKNIISITTIILIVLTGFTASSNKEIKDLQDPIFNISDNEIIEMIQQLDEDLVFFYHDKLMEFGPRYTGTESCESAGQFIYDEFLKMGLYTEFQNWKSTGTSGKKFQSRNIIATINGTDTKNKAIYIMSAHYDTVKDAPGADDDGSGVAAVLSAAKIMSQYIFNHTIKFIAFSGEEVGTLGSFCYARDSYRNGDNIKAVINADMVGYADTYEGGKKIRFSSPERSIWISDFAQNICDKYQNIIDLQVEPIPNYIGADHQAFFDYGYDGVWIVHHDGYQWGHSPDDTSDKINRTYQLKATKLLMAIMIELGIKPIDIQVIIRTPYEGYIYLMGDVIIYPFDLGILWYKGLRGMTFIQGRPVLSVDAISNEEIEYVIFCIDGNFMVWDRDPPYQWKIQGKHNPPIGRHKINVFAQTVSGKIATDEMDIIIFTLSSQYGPL